MKTKQQAGSEKAGPVDLNDPADVMAVLRGASRELQRMDQRIAEADARRAATEAELARVSEVRRQLESELDEVRARVAGSQAERGAPGELLDFARIKAAVLNEELNAARRSLARSRWMLGFGSTAALVVLAAGFSSDRISRLRHPVPAQAQTAATTTPAGPQTTATPAPSPQARPADFVTLGPPKEVKTVKVAPRSRSAQANPSAPSSASSAETALATPSGAQPRLSVLETDR